MAARSTVTLYMVEASLHVESKVGANWAKAFTVSNLRGFTGPRVTRIVGGKAEDCHQGASGRLAFVRRTGERFASGPPDEID
jgi:hypothetical protein